MTNAEKWALDEPTGNPAIDAEIRRLVTPRRPWQPVDLTPVLEGSYEPPQPTVGRRGDGRGLFYPGRCHTVSSETEGGKTWFVLAACLDEMKAGHHTAFIDFEDDEGAVVGRLLTMGAPRQQISRQFHYLRPDDPLGGGVNLADLDAMLTEYKPTLAILDGITEAMTMHGLNPLDNAETAIFGKMLPRRIAAYGPASVSCDHVTKDREGRGRYSIGAVHKLNGLNGAAYSLDNRHPFGVGITGRSTIKITKDRPGQLRRHGFPSAGGLSWYGDLVVDSHDDEFAEVTIEAPTEQGEDWRPTHLMQKVADAITKHPDGMSQRKIITAVGGKRQNAIDALNFLILDGYVSEQSPHQLLMPYPEDS